MGGFVGAPFFDGLFGAGLSDFLLALLSSDLAAGSCFGGFFFSADFEGFWADLGGDLAAALVLLYGFWLFISGCFD